MTSKIKQHIKDLRTKVMNMSYEWRLNISTRGLTVGNPNEPEHIHYGTIAYSTIQAILQALDLQSHDVLVDLGCGKGRVLCCAARIGILEVVGVECSPALSSEAKVNSQKLRGRLCSIRIEQVLAQEFDYSQGTVFYMFHPFGPGVLKQVLEKMEKGVAKGNRRIRIVYVNPVYENLLADCGWLEEYDRWEPNQRGRNEHVVSFWHSKGGIRT